MSVGIDYGLGQTNIDKANGIRFGVISQHSITEAWCERSEPDYGLPHCPKCGNEAKSLTGNEELDYSLIMNEYAQASHECADYVCESCEYVFGSESAFPDEPNGHYYKDEEYTLTDCLDSDVMVIRSPYWTYASFCSPCVPGAGNLNSASENGVKTYCLGSEWFDDDKAPYPIYSVETGERID